MPERRLKRTRLAYTPPETYQDVEDQLHRRVDEAEYWKKAYFTLRGVQDMLKYHVILEGEKMTVTLAMPKVID